MQTFHVFFSTGQNLHLVLRDRKIKHWQMVVTFYTGHVELCHLTWQPSQKRNRGESQLLSRAFSPLPPSRSLSDTSYPISPSRTEGSRGLVIMFNLFSTVSLVLSVELSKPFDLFLLHAVCMLNRVRKLA